ncbi:MAG: cupredoxin domain-containing protein [Solirubrobacteraceae bacterium]
MRPIRDIRPGSLILPAFVAGVVAAAALLLSHGGPPSSPTSSRAGGGNGAKVASGHVTIDISNFAYRPASVTVTVGTKITVVNNDDVEHTATSNEEGIFETGTLHRGGSASFTLSRVGTFPYHCAFHAFMHGTIEVVR